MLPHSRTLFPKGAHDRLVPELFLRAEVNPKARPFQLTVPEVGRICHAYQEIIQREPSMAKFNRHDKKESTVDGEEEDDEEALSIETVKESRLYSEGK